MNTPRLANGAAASSRGADRENARAKRGRIIVLGDERLIESVARVTHRPTTLAHHLYDVIGDLVQTGILDAPDAIVASVEALGVKTEPFVQAVRRIDPGVELIAITSNGSTTRESTAGFDACLTAPLDADALERAIQGESISHAPAQSPAPPQVQVVPQSAPPPQSPRDSSSAPLGDVDLVAALLRHPGEVEPLALRLIEQETGWRGLRIDANPSHTVACAEIRCGFDGGGAAVAYGYLIAPANERGSSARPTLDQLKPWADWIAHWLHLARSMGDLREKAYTDQLTGAYNRRFFEHYMSKALDDARNQRQCVSLLLFDIDDFKHYNDAYGHAAGDEILVETVKLLRSVIRPNDRVCRIGGDEFVVIFHDPQGQRERGSSHPDDIQQIARRFQQQICQHRFPKLSAEARGTLTISGGLSTYPWDGADVTTLLEQADRNAMASKRSGKNAITFGPGAGEVCKTDQDHSAGPPAAP